MKMKGRIELALALPSGQLAAQVATERDAVYTTMRDYAAALSALEHGGRVFALQVPAVPVEMQTLTTTLRSDWQTYRAHLGAMLGGRRDAAIVQTVLGLGRAFGLRTVAEGIETEAQLQFLIAHGCDQGQGYLFSRPLTADAFAALLRTQGGFALPS